MKKCKLHLARHWSKWIDLDVVQDRILQYRFCKKCRRTEFRMIFEDDKIGAD